MGLFSPRNRRFRFSWPSLFSISSFWQGWQSPWATVAALITNPEGPGDDVSHKMCEHAGNLHSINYLQDPFDSPCQRPLIHCRWFGSNRKYCFIFLGGVSLYFLLHIHSWYKLRLLCPFENTICHSNHYVCCLSWNMNCFWWGGVLNFKSWQTA